MRVAFVDLMFSWPPHGGADVDLYHTATQLQELGYDVHVFVAACERSWERGKFEPAQLPFPATRLDFTPLGFNRREVSRRFRAAIDAWQPDVVVLGDGFFLKPDVAGALAHYPTVCRYYAYEFACPRDLLLFKDDAPCPNSFLRTPDVCRRCALAHLGAEIKRGARLAWPREYLAARAFLPGYRRRLVRSIRRFGAIIVYNEVQRRLLEGFNENVVLVPGGVNVDEFDAAPSRVPDGRAIILMAGRAEDPAKGLRVLRDAGEQLAKNRQDFTIWITQPEAGSQYPWLQYVGWHDHAGMQRLYRQAALCVVPSLWEEPFGMVAVEAMASGRPVCASRVGGLQGIVRHEETGFLYDPEDSAVLAGFLGRLLDDPALRARMGRAGRRRAEIEYDWGGIVATHYPPLLEQVLS